MSDAVLSSLGAAIRPVASYETHQELIHIVKHWLYKTDFTNLFLSELPTDAWYNRFYFKDLLRSNCSNNVNIRDDGEVIALRRKQPQSS